MGSSRSIPLHWIIEPNDVSALIALHESTTTAELPNDWVAIMHDQSEAMSGGDYRVERLSLRRARAP